MSYDDYNAYNPKVRRERELLETDPAMTPEEVAKLPRFARPKNLYELCERVCEAIMAESRRYNQEMWADLACVTELGERREPVDKSAVPACGTVACRAGWMVEIELASRPDMDEMTLNRWITYLAHNCYLSHKVQGMAHEILRYDDPTAPDWYRSAVTNLFGGEALEQENPDLREADDEGGYSYNLPRRGTPEYAELGAKGVREFMAKYKGWLKSWDLDGNLLDRDGNRIEMRKEER